METPPNYSQYPRPNPDGGFGGGGRSYRGPGVYFEFITDAWNMIMKNMGVYVIGALLFVVINQVIQLPFQFFGNALLYGSPMGMNTSPGQMPKVNWSLFPVVMLMYIIPYSVSQVVALGISLCALEEADTGATSINTMFSGFRNFVSVSITTLLYVLAIYVGFVFCIIPAFFVAGAFAFAPIIAAKEGLGPIQSMQRSYEYLKPHAWAYFAFSLIAGIASFLGVIACCVGVLWTIPIMHIGLALHYREFRGPGNRGFVAPTMP